MREIARAMLKISALMDGFDEEDRHMLALEIYRTYGGPLSEAQRAVRYRLKRHESVTPASRKSDTPPSRERDEFVTVGRDARVSVVLSNYSELFLGKYGEKPQIHGAKDGAHAKRLLGQYGEVKVLELLRAFFDSTDPFILASGRSFGVFVSQINKLISNGHRPPKTKNPTHSPNCECARCQA